MSKLILRRGGFWKNEIEAVTHEGRVVMKFGDWVTIDDIRQELLFLGYGLKDKVIPQ